MDPSFQFTMKTSIRKNAKHFLVSALVFSAIAIFQESTLKGFQEIDVHNDLNAIQASLDHWYSNICVQANIEFTGEKRVAGQQQDLPPAASYSVIGTFLKNNELTRLSIRGENTPLQVSSRFPLAPLEEIYTPEFRAVLVDRVKLEDGQLRAAILEIAKRPMSLNRNERFVSNLPNPIMFAAGMGQGLTEIGSVFSENTYLFYHSKAQREVAGVDLTEELVPLNADGIINYSRILSKNKNEFIGQKFKFRRFETGELLLEEMSYSQPQAAVTGKWLVSRYERIDGKLIPVSMVITESYASKGICWKLECALHPLEYLAPASTSRVLVVPNGTFAEPRLRDLVKSLSNSIDLFDESTVNKLREVLALDLRKNYAPAKYIEKNILDFDENGGKRRDVLIGTIVLPLLMIFLGLIIISRRSIYAMFTGGYVHIWKVLAGIGVLILIAVFVAYVRLPPTPIVATRELPVPLRYSIAANGGKIDVGVVIVNLSSLERGLGASIEIVNEKSEPRVLKLRASSCACITVPEEPFVVASKATSNVPVEFAMTGVPTPFNHVLAFSSSSMTERMVNEDVIIKTEGILVPSAWSSESFDINLDVLDDPLRDIRVGQLLVPLDGPMAITSEQQLEVATDISGLEVYCSLQDVSPYLTGLKLQRINILGIVSDELKSEIRSGHLQKGLLSVRSEKDSVAFPVSISMSRHVSLYPTGFVSDPNKAVSQKICLRSRLPILCTNVSVDPPDSYFEVQHVAASPCEIEIRMITGSGDSTQLTSRKKERSNPQVCVSLEGGRSIRIPIYSLDEVMRPAVGSKKE